MNKRYEELIEPKKFKAGSIEYHVGKIPAFYAQRILLKSGSALKDFDLNKIPEDVILEILSHVAIINDNGEPVVLDNIDIINILLGSKTKELIEIELKAVEVNFGFFFDGSLRGIFDPLMKMVLEASAEMKED
jgi:hypothetical protein